MRPAAAGEAAMTAAKKQTKTIDEVLDEFLAEQEARWSPATYGKYETIIDLLKRYCEAYFPGHDGEFEKVTEGGGTFCGTYGPEDVAGAFGMFLGYFMPHKVICGSGTEEARAIAPKLPGKVRSLKHLSAQSVGKKEGFGPQTSVFSRDFGAIALRRRPPRG